MAKNLRQLIKEAVIEALSEGRFDHTATPHNSHIDVMQGLGVNPLTVDNGGHAANDVVAQVSTVDFNGENFKTNGNDLCVTNNKFMIYKIKNFGNDKIESTLSLFGRGAMGEKELRRAIDTVNGAATRNRRPVEWRTVTSSSNKRISDSTGKMSNTFWEFSLDGGSTWNIMKPNPIQNLQPTKVLLKPTNESVRRINEAADSQFSLKELSSLTSFRQRLMYCTKHLGMTIGNGSSRVVFQVNDQLCLKLAKNQKGVAQNQLEGEAYKERYDCMPKVYEKDDNDLWIVCEYVLPAKANDFQHCLGISWADFQAYIGSCFDEYNPRKYRGYRGYPVMDDERFYELKEENEQLYDFADYMFDYQPPIGDMLRLANYGMVRRYNQDMIVLLDHGLSEEIFDQYYKR